MDALTFDLVRMAKRKAEGSYATQANRKAMLKQMAALLKGGGYALASAQSVKPKHIQYLLEQWRAAGISDRTIENRLAVLRWWVEAVNKRSIMARTNEAYGVAKPVPGGPRAFELEPERLERITCPMVKASLELQAAFGLRREEAIKLRPSMALEGENAGEIHLKASWTKGGRARSVPITSEAQREVLARVRELAGNGSLIPRDKRYIQQLDTYKYQTVKAGVRNAHGLRHGYAQRRYLELTGWLAPAKGGVVPNTPAALRQDFEARQQISLELGHNRVAIVDVYLGRRVVAS